MDEATDVHPHTLSPGVPHERAWQVKLPHHVQCLAGFVEAFRASSSGGLGVDELGEIVVKQRGEVIVVSANRMATGCSAAALYCF